MQEKARAEVVSILGNEPVIPTSDQLKVVNNIIIHLTTSLTENMYMFFRK